MAAGEPRDVAGKSQQAGLDAALGSEAPSEFSHAVTRAMISFSEAMCARGEGRWSLASGMATSTTQPASAPGFVLPPVMDSSDGPTLRDLLGDYVKERKPPARTPTQINKAVLLLEEAVGGPIAAAAITKTHVRTYKELMLDYPRSQKKSHRELKPPEFVALYRGKGEYERISVATVTKGIALLSAIINLAEKEEMITANTFKNAKPPKSRRSRRGQISSESDIVTMFRAPFFAGCASDVRWMDPGAHVIWNANYWLIPLGLFTGARLEEIGQCLVSDIRHEAELWFIDINIYFDGTEETGIEQKSTKTESSIRQVPLHPTLLLMGFLRYVEQLRK